MRRPAGRTAQVSRRSSGDTAAVLVRAGDKEFGAITQLGSEENDMLSGNFANRPAFADVADLFLALGASPDGADSAASRAARAQLDSLGLEVWHSVHEMRIDEPGTLTIAGGRARFRANAAFHMMRTGGLG